MPRRPAAITQADIARVIRAAKQAGATTVEVQIAEKARVVISLNEARPLPEQLDGGKEIIL